MLQHIEPKIVWKHFESLNAVPRPSKKEERVIQFMLDFGKGLGLETLQDDAGNVIIKKPATKVTTTKKQWSFNRTWTWFTKKMKTPISTSKKKA